MSHRWHVLGMLPNSLLKAFRCYVNGSCVEQLDFKSILCLPVILFLFSMIYQIIFKDVFGYKRQHTLHSISLFPFPVIILQWDARAVLVSLLQLHFISAVYVLSLVIFYKEHDSFHFFFFFVSNVILHHQNQLERCLCFQQMQFCLHAK